MRKWRPNECEELRKFKGPFLFSVPSKYSLLTAFAGGGKY